MKIYHLPNNTRLFIHSNVIETMSKYMQIFDSWHESGGFLAGYQNLKTNSIIIDDLTTPYENDWHSRIMFQIKDPKHYETLAKFKKSKSFFIGTWHTHPSDYANYSTTDSIDWIKSLMSDIPAADYYVFVIIARKEIGVWIGVSGTEEIFRVDEIKENL